MIADQSHFMVAPPMVDRPRAKYRMNYNNKTTFNFGQLVPCYWQEMLPGDTFVADHAFLARMSTPIHPVMDNSFLDFYYFFVPNRLVWEHWKEFMGENNTDAWTPTVEYTIPQIVAPEGGFLPGSIADYMGLPTLVGGIRVSALPFRAYTLIRNEWFRSEALQDPAYCPLDDTDRTAIGYEGTDFEDSNLFGHTGGTVPFRACKFHDYFTSALPQPQRGPDTRIPLSPTAEVWGTGNPILLTNWTNANGSKTGTFYYDGTNLDAVTGNNIDGLNTGAPVGFAPEHLTKDTFLEGIPPLSADLENAGGTINELRLAFQLQKLLECDARGGGRYVSQIKAHFGVTSPDFRLQRPEYIGGKRQKLNMQQVLQTSATDSTSPQGNTAAYSLTGDADKAFTYSATEHGIVMCICVARTSKTYQQGIERSWSRKTRYDFYYPEFAQIGEMAVLNKEIYAQGNAEDDQVFGYQEAWADYRMKPSIVTGAFRSNTPGGSLDVWHYADYYQNRPTLSDGWIREGSTNVDRTLAVSSELADQLIMDYVLKIDAVRPIPLYSVPGLVDHF